MEVQLAGDQEDDCLDRGQAREPASATLGCLEQAVDGVQEPIGLAGLCPSHDALQVATRQSGHFLRRLHLGAHDATAPVLEHAAHEVDLLALQDLAQALLVELSPSRAHGRAVRSPVDSMNEPMGRGSGSVGGRKADHHEHPLVAGSSHREPPREGQLSGTLPTLIAPATKKAAPAEARRSDPGR